MNLFLRLKWELILLFQLELIAISHESIAGVTYRDNFDFEERYGNVYECDPFHWHPLHLPEYCAEMYEFLIRSRLPKQTPIRFVRKREEPETILCFILSASWVSTSISGISYMDPLAQKPLKPFLPGEDPCNPLYWYPKPIPEYCNKPKQPAVPHQPLPLPPQPLPSPPQPLPFRPMMPIPPIAIPVPYPMPPLMPPYPPQPIPCFPSAEPQFLPPPMPQFLPPPMLQIPAPYGVPLVPTNPMVPFAGMPYPPIFPPRPQAGLVPGIPGLVSQDGGINILPFSDVYSDMLEKHKQKMIRKRLQKVLDEYEDCPRNLKRRKYRGGRYF